ncbi:HAD family hydrolase, partial [Mycobacterium tuberculosis]|nr:HAD family hydrolase [Mycobacterium tuberculosis]
VFDKTGTLTLPEAAIADADLDPLDLARAGRLGLVSRHPLSAAIARAVGATLPAEDATEVPGQGVAATVDGVPCRLGSAA